MHPLIKNVFETNYLRIYLTDFHQISPCGRHLIVDYGSDPLFPIVQGTLPWQPILASKLAKSDYSPLFVALAFRNGLQHRTSDFKRFIDDDLATSCKQLVNVGPVTSNSRV